MSSDLRAGLVTAFKSDAAAALGLVYTENRDTRVGRRRTADSDADDKVFPVYIVWGGRTAAGVRSRFLRTVWQVIVVLDPNQTADPWKNVDDGVDKALEIINTVPGAFPELLPIIPMELDPARTGLARVQSGQKTYACAVIQVVGG